MPLADRNERILSATSTRPSRQHSAFGSSLPPSNKQSSVSTTQLANASRQPASRPGSARPTSADLLHGRGKTVMYEQLARATTARPSSGRATGRAVATFTPTNRYVDQAAAGSLRARAGVDGGVDSGVSIGSTSAYTTRYRPPVVVSNATLRERDWNNPNSPASRVKSSSGVTRSRPETAPIASIRTPVNTRARRHRAVIHGIHGAGAVRAGEARGQQPRGSRGDGRAEREPAAAKRVAVRRSTQTTMNPRRSRTSSPRPCHPPCVPLPRPCHPTYRPRGS